MCTMFTYVCMCAFTSWFESMAVAVFTGTLHIHPWLFIGFQHVALCRRCCWSSHGLLLLLLIITLASTCDSEQMFLFMKAKLLYLNPQVVFDHSPKTSATVLPSENSQCHLSLSSCPLFFLLFVSAIFLTVWNTSLCEFRKTQRYTPPP